MSLLTSAATVCCATIISCSKAPGGAADSAAAKSALVDTNQLRVYQIGKKVSAFPPAEDLSTPEAAYVACNRVSASGDEAGWRRLSVERLARAVASDAKRREVKASAAKEWLEAEVVEIRIYRDTNAAVFAHIPHAWKKIIDVRSFEREGGRWLNSGNCVLGSLDESRAAFLETVLVKETVALRDSRKPIADPAAHLRTFVEFLQKEGQEPKEFLLEAVAKHPMVIIGELHHRPSYWAFNSSLVGEARFADKVGTIYLELPQNDQPLVEKFLAAPTLDPAPVIAMLRDFFEMGWPDQAMLDFFVAVWKANQPLPPARRLRIVLVDMARPWTEIKARQDCRKYDTDRDALMARNIISDRRAHRRDSRHALFIVGATHACSGLQQPTGEWFKRAGWHLRQELGPDQVRVILQHRPVSANNGRVEGRVALGLFDSAFAALTNRPLAFPLDHGPFGEQLYDASLDHPTFSLYRDAASAYLYLGRLEDEIFSPLIPAFYTAEHIKEIDRRYRLMNDDRPWHEIFRRKETTPEEFIAWMSKDWGQPRREWSAASLGPLHAWHYGSEWRKAMRDGALREASRRPEVVLPHAQRLFAAIRRADYTRDWKQKDAWMHFLPEDTDYLAASGFNAWVDWVCREFSTNPIVEIELGPCRASRAGLPAAAYKLARKTGGTLEGELPFDFNPATQCWHGQGGLDWHLRSASRIQGRPPK
ncbi:MAG: hypothetical protein HZA90_26775 [Verrucomicrobia bacterium]|nr:hypothetical protein [Verrucomicrobiota bacterium]